MLHAPGDPPSTPPRFTWDHRVRAGFPCGMDNRCQKRVEHGNDIERRACRLLPGRKENPPLGLDPSTDGARGCTLERTEDADALRHL